MYRGAVLPENHAIFEKCAYCHVCKIMLSEDLLNCTMILNDKILVRNTI